MTVLKNLQIVVAYGGLRTETAGYCQLSSSSLQITDGLDNQSDFWSGRAFCDAIALSADNNTLAHSRPKSP